MLEAMKQSLSPKLVSAAADADGELEHSTVSDCGSLGGDPVFGLGH